MKDHHRNKKLLIEGDFAPSRKLRRFRIMTAGLGMLFLLCLVFSMGLYGVTEYFASAINDVGMKTRSLSDDNRALQVRLNRIQSYQRIEAAAKTVPNLQPLKDVVDVDPTIEMTRHLPRLSLTPSPRHRELPKVYGY